MLLFNYFFYRDTAKHQEPHKLFLSVTCVT